MLKKGMSAILALACACCLFSFFPGKPLPAAAAEEPVSIFGDLSGQEISVSSEDGVALHLATRFATKVSGTITKVRAYTSPEENGTYLVSFWGVADSELLASYEWTVTKGIEGWQEFTLPEAFSVEAYTDYILAVKNNDGSQYYSFVKSYFGNTDFSDSLFIIQQDSGVFTTSDDSMPVNTNTISHPAFLRDVVFVPDPVTPPPAQEDMWKEAQSAYLSDLKWGGSYSYGSRLQVDMATEFESLSIGSQGYDKGFAFYASSKEGDAFVEINIENLGMKTFASYVGIAHPFSPSTIEGTAVFIVEVDGKEAVRSEVLSYSDEPVRITADVTGGKVLRLSVGNAGDSCSGDLAAWGSPILSKYATAEEIYANLSAVTTPVPTETPEQTPTPKLSQKASPSPTAGSGKTEQGGTQTGIIIGVAAGVVIVVAAGVIIFRKKKKK